MTNSNKLIVTTAVSALLFLIVVYYVLGSFGINVHLMTAIGFIVLLWAILELTGVNPLVKLDGDTTDTAVVAEHKKLQSQARKLIPGAMLLVTAVLLVISFF